MSAFKWVVSIVGGFLVLTIAGLLAFGLRPSARRVQGSVEINRPIAEIWPWMTEGEKLKQWISWLLEVRQHSATRATWVMEDRNNNNQRMEIEGEITELHPPSYSKARLSATGAFTGTSEYRLTDLGGNRTKVEQAGEYYFEHWLAKLMEPLITPQANRKLEADLATLKQKVESAPGAAAAR